jgi:cytochrome c-type biogenesis protein CcmE
MIRRWLFIIFVLGAVSALAWQRYQSEVSSYSPLEFSHLTDGQQARVLGRVQAGSLKMSANTLKGTSDASFSLEAQGALTPVIYAGPDMDTLRELKTILAQGVRQADGSLRAGRVSIAPNYAYIVGAYGSIALILLLFAFLVERQLRKIQKTLDKEG